MAAPAHPYLDHPQPIAFAHRGGTEAAPENTLAAFQAAVDTGFRYLETDVHATRDGYLVAFHDDSLDRLTDRSGQIADLSLEEVRAARIQGHEIPIFEELIASFPDARFNIDPKSDRAATLLADSLVRLRLLDRICVGSFSDARLTKLRERFGARLCTSMGPRDVLRLRLASWGLPVNRRFRALAAQVPTRWPLRPGVPTAPVVDERFLAEAHRLGVPVHVWTVNDATEMNRLLGLGVDGIMTDRPALLKVIMQGHGLWKL